MISGFLVIDSFSSPEEMDGMMKMMEQLLHDFDCSAKASVFSSKNQVSISLKKKAFFMHLP